MAEDFSEAQVERYSRQMLLKEVGPGGQRKLAASRALVVGAGGLGSPALLYLAAAGVGRLGVADGETVELSNLGRQLVVYDGLAGTSRSARRVRDPACPLCGPHASITRIVAYEAGCCSGGRCGPDGRCVPKTAPGCCKDL